MDRVGLGTLVDLERYPLGDGERFGALLAACRSQLAHESFVRLPGFLRPGVAARMAAEVLAALPRAYRREQAFSAYDAADVDRYPAGHVRRRVHWNRQHVVSNDILPRSGLLVSLYHDDTLTRAIAAILAEPVLHRLADPVMACTATVMAAGDTHGWHFDLNDFVVSILLQAPAGGGRFEFAPYVRSDADERYDAVAAVMDGASAEVRSERVEAGTLLIFCGRRALHRVSPVEGATPRVIGLLSYDRVPGVVYPSDVYQRVVGRRAPVPA